MKIKKMVFLFVLFISSLAMSAQRTTPANCSEMSWQDCALLTKQQLQKAKSEKSPERALRIVNTYWAPAFEKAYLSLAGPERQNDTAKIKDEIESAVKDEIKDASGYTKVKNEAIDSLTKRYLPRLAPVLAAIGGAIGHPLVEAALIFFWPSPTASDQEMLKLENEEIHRELAAILAPHFLPEWPKLYLDSLKRAGGPIWEARPRLP